MLKLWLCFAGFFEWSWSLCDQIGFEVAGVRPFLCGAIGPCGLCAWRSSIPRGDQGAVGTELFPHPHVGKMWPTWSWVSWNIEIQSNPVLPLYILLHSQVLCARACWGTKTCNNTSWCLMMFACPPVRRSCSALNVAFVFTISAAMTHGESSGAWSTFATSQSGLRPGIYQDLTGHLTSVILVIFHFFLLRWLPIWPRKQQCLEQPKLVKKQLSAEESFYKKVLTCHQLQDVAGSAAAFQEVGQEITGYNQTPALLLKTFKMQGCSGSLAWDLYQSTKDKVEYSRALYHAVMSISLKGQNVDSAMEVLRDMILHDVLPDSIAYANIIRSHLARGDLESSMQLLGQMQRQEVIPDFSTFQAVLEACANRHLPVLAEEVLRSMEQCNVRPSSCTLATMLRIYGRNGDVGAALQSFQEMPKKFGFSADSQAFACLISVCVAEGEIAEAFQVYEQMSSAGIQADASCFKALLSGCLQQGDLDTAARLIGDAQSQRLGLARESLELFLLQSVRRGRSELAMPVLEEARSMGIYISERIVNSVQRACEKWSNANVSLSFGVRLLRPDALRKLQEGNQEENKEVLVTLSDLLTEVSWKCFMEVLCSQLATQWEAMFCILLPGYHPKGSTASWDLRRQTYPLFISVLFDSTPLAQLLSEYVIWVGQLVDRRFRRAL